MGHKQSPAEQFAAAFRGVLEDQKLGVRTLARRRDPQNVDRERRNLHRWLAAEHFPTLPVRRQLAVDLGVDASEFEVETDDAEAAEFMAALMPLARAFSQIADQRVEHALRLAGVRT